MARPKKKFLWCPTCDCERWCNASGFVDFMCRECGGKVNVVAASNAKRRRKAERLADRTGQLRLDPKYVAWVRTLDCLRCGAPPPNHAHHSVHRSQGGADRTCVPLCIVCHAEYHDRLGSVVAALAAWGIDLRHEAGLLNRTFDTPEPDAI